jgi:hypothetical protein
MTHLPAGRQGFRKKTTQIFLIFHEFSVCVIRSKSGVSGVSKLFQKSQDALFAGGILV